MRIIEGNSQEKITVCPHCATKIGYTNEDTFNNTKGRAIECPYCHDIITVERFNRTLPFPDAYFDFGNGVDISNTEIEKWVKNGIKSCIKNDSDGYYTASGNTYVDIKWLEGDNDFDIVVCKNYYNATISRNEAIDLINE